MGSNHDTRRANVPVFIVMINEDDEDCYPSSVHYDEKVAEQVAKIYNEAGYGFAYVKPSLLN